MDWWRSSKSICIKEKSQGKQDILPSNINLHTREKVFIQKIKKKKEGEKNTEEGKDNLHIFQVKGAHHSHIGVCVCKKKKNK